MTDTAANLANATISDDDIRSVTYDIVDEDMNVFEIALKAMKKYGLLNVAVSDTKSGNGWPEVTFTGAAEDIDAFEYDFMEGNDITE